MRCTRHLTQSQRLDVDAIVRRMRLIFWTILLVPPIAFSQSDEDLLEKVRANGVKIYLEQASFTLPQSFHKSGLAPSDKKRLIEQWANDSATCHADVLAAYAIANDIPLSELVSDDGTYGFGLGVPADWELHLKSCLARTWEVIGAKLPE